MSCQIHAAHRTGTQQGIAGIDAQFLADQFIHFRGTGGFAREIF